MGWTHDVVVVGAGAAGLTAAGGCARLGLRVALVERDRMGGECLHSGCVPSKALLAAAHRAEAMRGHRLGVTGSGPVVEWRSVRAHIDATIAAIAPNDSAERFAGWGVELLAGSASLTGRRTLSVAGRSLSAPRIVLATGSDPALPPIPGLPDTPFLTNETLWRLDRLPHHLLVLGGGSVGVEMAQAFRRLGSAVTLVERGPLLAGADPDAAALLRRALEAEGVLVLDRTTITRAFHHAGRIGLDRDDGPPLDGSDLLVATGRRPRLDGLGLERAGVAADADGIRTDRHRRTTNRAVYAIGDCRAGPRLTHAAGRDGALVVSAIGFGLPGRSDPDTMPAVLYTEPELAQLGPTEAALRARHRRVAVTTAPLSGNDRAVAEADTAGWLKLVRTGRRVRGVTIVGARAGDLVLPWSLVMERRASLWGLANATVSYPTRSELSKAASWSAYEALVFGPAARGWARLLARLRRAASRPG